MTKKEKIEIGKKIHDGEMTVKDAADAVGLVLDDPPSKEPSIDAARLRGSIHPAFEGLQDDALLLLGVRITNLPAIGLAIGLPPFP